MFERYTEKARRTIFFARYEASLFGSSYIESEHMLLGLLREEKSLIPMLRIPSAEGLRQKIEERLGPPKEKISTSIDLPLSHECKRVLTYAAEDAEKLGSRNIETWHLALGLLRNKNSGVAELLGENGINHHKFMEIVRTELPPEPDRVRPPEPVEEPSAEDEGAKPAAASLELPLERLRSLIERARPHLKFFSNADGAVKLKRKDWSRRQAMGHLIDWAATYHVWMARAMTEPRVTVAGYPTDQWVDAQHYDLLDLQRLVALWLAQNSLLLHVMAQIPEARLETPFRLGIEEPTTLRRVIERYVEHCEDLVAQVLVRS